MKCKPRLLKKALLGRCTGFREMIGIIGAHKGAGVTHTGIMLAFYLGEELGRKTALLECNRNHDFSILEGLYDWPHRDGISFGFGQITLYKDVTLDMLPNILGDNYEYIILDFGSDVQTNLRELQRCGKKLILGGRSDWEKHKLSSFIHTLEAVRGSEGWDYLIPMATDKTISGLVQATKRRVWSVPVNEEPMVLSKKACSFFDELLHPGI